VRKILMGAVALSVLGLMVTMTSPIASAKTRVAAAGPSKQKAHNTRHHKGSNTDPTIYNSTVEPNPGNLASESFEATATAQFGNQISFGGSARVLNNVVVQMSSWGCQSGSWTGTPSPCVTSPGATFTEPITLNIYNVGPATANGPSSVGSLVASDTQTFAIPYRPSADATHCSTAPDNGTQWFDAGLNACFNGYLNNIEFTFGHVSLPDNVIYGVAYNTSDWGANPYGDLTACHSTSEGCGYDSLNVALSQQPSAPSVGTNAYPGTVYEDIVNAGYQGNYCDGGAAGINVFRIDEPTGYPTNNGSNDNCWSINYPTVGAPWYTPAVEFNALVSPSPTITSPATANVVAGTPFSFTVTTTGVPTPVVKKLSGGKLPKGLVFKGGTGTATISGTALTTNKNRNYTIAIQAINGKRSSARQRLVLTLTGGR
jgi:hypothetical protein